MDELAQLRTSLLTSHLEFTKTFFEIKNGRPFVTPGPIGRESHYLTISRELENVFDLKCNRLLINVPPGYGKSTLLVYFVAWALAQYPDSQFLYISYSYELAEKHTATIKEIIELPDYQRLFGVKIASDTKARGNFKTTAGGTVTAFGTSGGITGRDAGLPYLERFSGMAIIDDAHKPEEVHSKTIRERVITNYNETIKPRPRSENVPIVFIGQRLHQSDLAAFLISGEDGKEWKKVIIKAIDEAGNALCPEIHSIDALRTEQKVNKYMFSSQYMQDPVPSGGALFLEEWFTSLTELPSIIYTFLTIDTAETANTVNDPTVFSFWGVHKVFYKGIDTGLYGLVWIDCLEGWYEPADLEAEFMQFYSVCMRFKVKPAYVAIEKKNTGVTLLSILKRVQGIRLIDIERTKASGSKAARHIEMQPFVAQKLITFPPYAKHTKKCVDHMTDITANDSHTHDDICDTAYDAVKLALIDKFMIPREDNKTEDTLKEIADNFGLRQTLMQNRKW